MPDDDEDAGDDDDEPDPGEEADPGPGQVTARSGEPYVITEPSFFEDEPTYEKLTITWYEGDNVLVDDKSVPVRNVKWTIGEDFSAHYGPGSSDPNIVYVRNPRLGVDFEVVRDGRSFQEVMFSYRREAGAYGNPG